MADFEQGSQEWLRERAGKINASEMYDVLAFAKNGGKPLKARTDLIAKIVGEILTGEPASSVRAKSLDWGHDVEAAARQAYSAATGEIVETIVGVTHPLYPFIRCSPDGAVRPNGGIQIKCPASPVVHINTLRHGMDDEHKAQVQAEIWIQGLEWLDFVSFDPRMPEHLRLYIERITPDHAFIAAMETHCLSLWVEVQDLLETLNLPVAA